MNNPFFPKHMIFILLIFILSFGFVSCTGGNPALNTTWSLTKLVSVGVPIEDSVTEIVEVKNCGIPIEKTTDCSAGTLSDLTVSANGGGAFGAGAQFTLDAGVGTTLGIGKTSGQSVKLETPPDGFIYTYTVSNKYKVINGEAIASSSIGEEQVVNYSFHASCSIDIISKEQISCSGNSNNIPPANVPTATESNSISTSTFKVYANLSWQNTGIQINLGDRVRIIWDGTSKWRGTNSGEFSDPLGGWIDNTKPQFACSPLMSPDVAGWNALVAKIGDNGIVTNPFKEIPQGEGELKFAMNDCDSQRYDNEGSVVVTIEITR